MLLLKISFVFDFWQIYYNVSQCSPIWDISGLTDLDVHFSSQVWKIFSHYCFKYTLCSSLFLSWWNFHKYKHRFFSFYPVGPGDFLHSFLFIYFFVSLTGQFEMSCPPCLWFFLLHDQVCFRTYWVLQINYIFQFYNLFFLWFLFICKIRVLFKHYFPNFV